MIQDQHRLPTEGEKDERLAVQTSQEDSQLPNSRMPKLQRIPLLKSTVDLIVQATSKATVPQFWLHRSNKSYYMVDSALKHSLSTLIYNLKACKDPMFTLTPGPIVEQTVSDFQYTPLDPGGLLESTDS